MTENEEYITIGKYFEDYLENKECRVIKFIPVESWAGNPKTKKQTRCKVLLPKEVCDTNLKELDNWVLTIVAIPRKILKG